MISFVEIQIAGARACLSAETRDDDDDDDSSYLCGRWKVVPDSADFSSFIVLSFHLFSLFSRKVWKCGGQNTSKPHIIPRH